MNSFRSCLKYCDVLHCNNSTRDCTFFGFPADPERLKKWNKFLQVKDPKKNYKYACNAHFEMWCFSDTFKRRLIRYAYPTIMPQPSNEASSKQPCPDSSVENPTPESTSVIDEPESSSSTVTSSTSLKKVTDHKTSDDSVNMSWNITRCVFCNRDLKVNDEPKLLQCFHTACKSCLESAPGSGSSSSNCNAPGWKLFLCPKCNQDNNSHKCIDHLFAIELLSKNSKDFQDNIKIYSCTSCEEEEVNATGFCCDCQEWLCEACISAHRRVRLTKDHGIRPKEEIENEKSGALRQKCLFCPVHIHEQLKLYCYTCNKLTCRDCQLLEHNKHEYKFLSDTCEEEKSYINTLLLNIEAKQSRIVRACNLLSRQQVEIFERERTITQEIKSFADKFIEEINKRVNNLLEKLSGVCNDKRNQLSDKIKKFTNMGKRLQHCIKFTKSVILHGSETALAYSKKSINRQLLQILRSKFEVPTSKRGDNIIFSCDPTGLLHCIKTFGILLVDQHLMSSPQSVQNKRLAKQARSCQKRTKTSYFKEHRPHHPKKQRNAANASQNNFAGLHHQNSITQRLRFQEQAPQLASVQSLSVPTPSMCNSDVIVSFIPEPSSSKQSVANLKSTSESFIVDDQFSEENQSSERMSPCPLFNDFDMDSKPIILNTCPQSSSNYQSTPRSEAGECFTLAGSDVVHREKHSLKKKLDPSEKPRLFVPVPVKVENIESADAFFAPDINISESLDVEGNRTELPNTANENRHDKGKEAKKHAFHSVCHHGFFQEHCHTCQRAYYYSDCRQSASNTDSQKEIPLKKCFVSLTRLPVEMNTFSIEL